MENTFSAYIVYSSFSTHEVEASLLTYTENGDDLGDIRSDMSRDDTGKYCDSNRHIILCKSSLYKSLVEAGLGDKNSDFDFYIVPYEFRHNNYPPNGCCEHLYFPATPENIKNITDMMTYYTKLGLIPESRWYVSDRGIVKFHDAVERDNRALIKLIIDNPAYFRVSWCKNSLFSGVFAKKKSSKLPSIIEETVPRDLPRGRGTSQPKSKKVTIQG